MLATEYIVFRVDENGGSTGQCWQQNTSCLELMKTVALLVSAGNIIHYVWNSADIFAPYLRQSPKLIRSQQGLAGSKTANKVI